MGGAKQTASAEKCSLRSDRPMTCSFPVIATLLTACVAPPDGAREEIGKVNLLESFSRQLRQLRADNRTRGLSVAVVQRLTLVLLANSEGLSADFQLGRGNVPGSPFAVAFLQSIMKVAEWLLGVRGLEPSTDVSRRHFDIFREFFFTTVRRCP